jgi:hypothetical protein
VLRDHTVAAAWVPAGTQYVSQYQDPERVFLMHNQEGLGLPQISVPVQGSVTAGGGLLTDRQFFDLVDSGAPQSTITLRMQWSGTGTRLTLDVDPDTLPISRFRTLGFRIGQSTEAPNPAGQDQDLTLEFRSGSKTASVPVSTLHRLMYPDASFGGGKTVMQSLRLPLRRLAALGLRPEELRSISFVYVGDVQLSH